MEAQVRQTVDAGLRTLEVHPLLHAAPTLGGLGRFEAHSLVFGRALGRYLERRVARNLDRETPWAAAARLHLRIHQPFPRALERHLTENLGHTLYELGSLELGPRTRRWLSWAERAFQDGDPAHVHVMLVHGFEGLSQRLARRGAYLVKTLGGSPGVFERRHRGYECLLGAGAQDLRRLEPDRAAGILDGLRGMFEEAGAALNEWVETDPPRSRPRRAARRVSDRHPGDHPGSAA